MAARCIAQVKHRLQSPYQGYGPVQTPRSVPRGTDLTVPHSELAMHARAAGKQLIAWACKPSGRECGIVFAEKGGGCGHTFGLPSEVLPHAVRRATGLAGRRKRRR